MKNHKKNWIFSFASNIFYNYVSPKFRTGSFKNLMDITYIIFEKIAVNFKVLYLDYINIYQELVEKEVDLCNISSDESVLIIGCGSIPVTSILVSKNSSAKEFVSIDYDLKAVENAIKLVSSTTFDKNLKFEHADGFKYPVEKFDVIFVLYGIQKQDKILEYLSKNIKDTSRIIFRTTNDSLIQLIGGKEFLEKYFIVEKSICSEKFNDTISFLLKKK
jgi:2-polyprenyl-3-methyl-5-hydroxy-6-metoxy-1,4-benzoquinol methylase